jgi:hypothetical protein
MSNDECLNNEKMKKIMPFYNHYIYSAFGVVF